MVIRVGINGVSKIGKTLLRSIFEKLPHYKVQIIAINDPFLTPKQIAYLLKYDTAHKRFKKSVTVEENALIIENEHRVLIFKEKFIENIPWGKNKVDIVVEASGLYTSLKEASKHIQGFEFLRKTNFRSAGAKMVIISDPSDAPTFILGVNEDKYKKDVKVFSVGDPTLNALGPITKIIEDHFGIVETNVASIQSLSPLQNTIDGSMNMEGVSARLGRSMDNIIPTKFGIGEQIGKLLPNLVGKMNGIKFYVPTLDVSLLDITLLLKETTNPEQLTRVLKKAIKEERYKNIINITEDYVVSSDFIGEAWSITLDPNESVQAVNGNLLKIIGWYDENYAFAGRIIDMIQFVSRK